MTVEFQLTVAGVVTFELVGYDGVADRTFYSDLGANPYTFGTLGKDYGSGVTPTVSVTVS